MACQVEMIPGEIPGEILLTIARLLSYRDLCNLALVCRRWWKVASDPFLWKSFPVSLRFESPETVMRILSSHRFSLLENVRISDKFWSRLNQETLNDYIKEISKKKSVKSIQICLERDVLETPQVRETEKLIGKLPNNIEILRSDAEILQQRYNNTIFSFIN